MLRLRGITRCVRLSHTHHPAGVGMGVIASRISLPHHNHGHHVNACRWASTTTTDAAATTATNGTTAGAAPTTGTGSDVISALSHATPIDGTSGDPWHLNWLARSLCAPPSNPHDIWTPAEWIRDALVTIHDYVPHWWAVIPVSALIWRTLSAPVPISQIRSTETLPYLFTCLDNVASSLNRHATLPLPMKQLTMRSVRNALSRGYHAQFWRILLPPFVIQLPMFVTFAMAARSLMFTDPSFTGVAWFQNLTIPDPYFVLPVISTALLWASFEVSPTKAAASSIANPPPARTIQGFLHRFMKSIQMFYLMLLPIWINLPAGFFLYMIPSTLWTIVTRIIQRQPRIKSWVSNHYQLSTIPTQQSLLPARVMASLMEHQRDERAAFSEQYRDRGGVNASNSLPWYTRKYHTWSYHQRLQKRMNGAVMDGRNNVPLSSLASSFATSLTDNQSVNSNGVTYGIDNGNGDGTSRPVYTSVIARDIAQTLTGVPQQLASNDALHNASTMASPVAATPAQAKPSVEVAHVNRRKQKKK